MKKKHSGLIGFLFLILISLTSCIEKELDFENIKTQKWNSVWALPLINSNLTLDDLLNDTTGIIHENEDGLITLVYESEELISYIAEEIVEIPDQAEILNEEFDLPDTLFGLTIEVDVPFALTFELEEPGLRIDSAILKNGTYDFTVRTDLNKDVASVGFTVPNIVNKSNNSPLQFEFDLGYQPGINEIVRDTTIDLSNYTLVFENSGNSSNTILIIASVSLTDDANPNNSPYFLSIGNVFENMEFEKFFGYIGHQVVNLHDTIPLSVFALNEDGYFSLGPESVIIKIDVFNSFGLPVMLDIVKFKAYHSNNNDSVDIYLFGEGNSSEIEINYPTLNQIGQEIYTEVISDNSNINEVIEISPDKIFFDIDGQLNPDNDTTMTNFVLDTSTIRTYISLNLELFGSVHGFKVADTVDFEMENIDEIKSLQFVVDIENGFPINTNVQLYFVDSVYNVLHSLLHADDQLMVAAVTGSEPDYKVISPSQKTTYIEVNDEEIKNLAETKEIIINVTLSTNNGQMVKIYNDYYINLKMGAKVGLSL